jgi:hypothetical protein
MESANDDTEMLFAGVLASVKVSDIAVYLWLYVFVAEQLPEPCIFVDCEFILALFCVVTLISGIAANERTLKQAAVAITSLNALYLIDIPLLKSCLVKKLPQLRCQNVAAKVLFLHLLF